jgi:hypothetical protein
MTHRSLGACAPKRFGAQARRWVCLLGTMGLPVGLHYLTDNEIDLSIFDSRHRNDEMGAPAYDPAILLKIIKIRNCVTNPGSLDDRK